MDIKITAFTLHIQEGSHTAFDYETEQRVFVTGFQNLLIPLEMESGTDSSLEVERFELRLSADVIRELAQQVPKAD